MGTKSMGHYYLLFSLRICRMRLEIKGFINFTAIRVAKKRQKFLTNFCFSYFKSLQQHRLVSSLHQIRKLTPMTKNFEENFKLIYCFALGIKHFEILSS